MTKTSNINAGGNVQQIAAGGSVQVTSHTDTGDITPKPRYGCLVAAVVSIVVVLVTVIAAWVR